MDGRWSSERSVGTFAKLSLPPGDHALHICDTDAALDAYFTTLAGQKTFIAASQEGVRLVDEFTGRGAIGPSHLVRAYDAVDAMDVTNTPGAP
jgi:hypothetical protein